MCDRAGFFRKNPHRAKMTKNGQKWPQDRVFGLLKKIKSLVLENGMSSQLWIRRQDCFTILHNVRGQERHGNYINGFCEQKSDSVQFGHFGPKMVCPHNFGSALSFFS